MRLAVRLLSALALPLVMTASGKYGRTSQEVRG